VDLSPVAVRPVREQIISETKEDDVIPAGTECTLFVNEEKILAQMG
jgi:hypothetical protein